MDGLKVITENLCQLVVENFDSMLIQVVVKLRLQNVLKLSEPIHVLKCLENTLVINHQRCEKCQSKCELLIVRDVIRV